MLPTGVRIGEALAVVWNQILSSAPNWATTSLRPRHRRHPIFPNSTGSYRDPSNTLRTALRS
jgi:hypothetical protein